MRSGRTPHLSLVTLSYNNPAELQKTLRSVALQRVKPSRHLVVDGSSDEWRVTMKAIAEASGGEYLWFAPKGIYDAMRKSLEVLPTRTWVWWLNSSDWLAGTSSIEIALDSIRAAGGASGRKWVVGQLIRRRRSTSGIFPVGYSGRRFVANMRFGKIGFPHPSTIFWSESLRRIDAFSTGLSIAEDYALGLEFGSRYGYPFILKKPLAVHSVGGISFQRPGRNLLEKSVARRRLVPTRTRWAEFLSLIQIAPRGIWRRAMKTDVGTPVPAALWEETDWGSVHYCAPGGKENWPRCCDHVL